MEASAQNALGAGNHPSRGHVPYGIDHITLRAAIPARMQEARRWLVWKSIPNPDPTKKPSKVPVYTNGAWRTKTDTPEDQAQLVGLAEALATLLERPGHFAGIGFALGADGRGGHWQGIDLDHTDTRPELAARTHELPGYRELSPSGTGVHAIGYGPDFPTLGSNTSGIEAYSHGRYFTVTGAAIGGTLEDLAPFVRRVLAPLHGAVAASERGELTPVPTAALPAPVDFMTPPAEPSLPAPVDLSNLPVTPAQVEELREALTYIDSDSRTTWVNMAHALHAQGEVGFALWDAWSQTSDKYDPADARRVWDSAKGEHTGYRAVFAAAQQNGWKNPRAGGGQSPDAEDGALIRDTITHVPADSGALFAPAVIDALARTKATDPAEYERLRDQAAKAGFRRLTELDKQVRRRICVFSRENINSSKSSTSSISSTGAGFRAVDPAQRVLVALDLGDGSMVRWSDRGPELLAGSHAAMVAAPAMVCKFAHCPRSNVWHHFTGAHWEPQTSGEEVKRAVTVAMYPATSPVGFSSRYVEEILRLVENIQALPLPAPPPMAIPFRNGLLDPATRQLAPISPTNAMTWSLPYDCDPGADCPTVKAWLLKTVDGDAPTVELLRAWLAALLTGRADLQRFLHLPGPGGSGKGTFMRLCAALVGQQNLTSTDLRTLEQNRFESATIYGKRLVLITDSDKYGGSINVLKALTGQDPIRLERKHVQQAGTFTFEGLVMMASNEPLATTDFSSGFERRRITVEFNRVASEAEKQAWREQGGEESVLHRELSGVVNWALGLTPADVSRIIAHPPQRTQAANLEALIAGNSVADWLVHRCAPDPDSWSQVGAKEERRRPDGSVYYDREDDCLYPSYLAWTRGTGKSPVSLRRFRGMVEDTARNTLKADIPNRPRKSDGRGISGLRLLAKWEQPFDWLAHVRGQPALKQHPLCRSDCPETRTSAGCAACAGFGDTFNLRGEKTHPAGSPFLFQEPTATKKEGL